MSNGEPGPSSNEGSTKPRRRRWPLFLGLGLVAMLGFCIALPSLLPTEGKYRNRAELERLVTENRATLDDLVALARKETVDVWVETEDVDDVAGRYRPFLERLGLKGPLRIVHEPFEVHILLRRSSGRDREELVFGPEPRPSDLVDDLDQAHDRSPGGGSVYMRLTLGWLVWRTWD